MDTWWPWMKPVSGYGAPISVEAAGIVPGATGYLWTVPAGTTIVSGQNTASVLVNFSSSASSGPISVASVNNCGESSLSKLEIDIHQKADPVLTGSATACENSTETYFTNPSQTQYLWTFSPGGSVVAGGTINSDFITIQWIATGPQWVNAGFTDVNGCISNLTLLDIEVTIAVTAGISILQSANPVCEVPISVLVSPSANPVCTGISVTFTASPANGGTNPVYQWKVNGIM